VPPPSTQNRRVTPELDAIVFKALARDVADRYQSAAQLQADLDALIAGYRFDPKELRQFMRQSFRKEYAEELEDTQQALTAQPERLSGRIQISITDTGRFPAGAPGGGSGPASGPVTEPDPPPPIRSGQHPQRPSTAPSDERSSKSFWGTLFRRKK
jgi:serine/threonine-protein kinase